MVHYKLLNLDMTSRERVLAVILHKNLDKVPVDLCATPSSGISAIAYSNLLKHIGQPEGQVKIFMPAEIYRKLFKPRHKILCDYVKSHSSMHTFIHSCGSIAQIILKREFGRTCTFWGEVLKLSEL